jgi:hypothetical protein
MKFPELNKARFRESFDEAWANNVSLSGSLVEFQINRSELARGLRFVSEFASKDRKSEMLLDTIKMTLLEVEDGQAIRLTATDLYKCGGYYVRLERPVNYYKDADIADVDCIDEGLGDGAGRHFLLGRDDVKNLLNLLKDEEHLNSAQNAIANAFVSISLTSNRIAWQPQILSTSSMFMKPIEGKSHKVESVIPKKEKLTNDIPNGIVLGSEHLQKTINAFKHAKVDPVHVRFQGAEAPVWVTPSKWWAFGKSCYPFGLIMPVESKALKHVAKDLI